METQYKHLFSPLRIGDAMLMNRIIASPLGAHKIYAPSTTNYGGISVVDRSKGGAAAITLNYMEVAEAGHGSDAFAKYNRDATREIISVVKQGGALANLEIFFHGMMPRKDGTMMMPCDGFDYRGHVARGMTQEEIQHEIAVLANTAKQAKEFGFDMITLHLGHDSLTSLFLSPIWNQREDEYGGNLEGRIRITKEAVAAVRAAVGEGFPLIARLSRYLYVKESYDENDMIVLIKNIEKYINMVNISSGMDEYGGKVEKYIANGYAMTTNFEPHMLNVAFAEKVKKETNVLVCPVGAIETPEEAEQIIASGKADAVMMGRALIADPYLPKKAMDNHTEDIVPCLRCLQCYHVATEHINTICSVNPRFRRENRVPLTLEKTKDPKKVVVVGAGPAGCKAALTAAQKGHHVILLEKSDVIGGQINVSDYDESKQDLKRYRDYLRTQIKKSSVKVHLHIEADKSYVEALHPDVIIVAVGAEQIVPPLYGVEHAQLALSVYPHLDQIKNERIIIIGGGTIGTELAVELAARNNKVAVVDMAKDFALRGHALYRLGLQRQIDKYQSKISSYLECTVKEIFEKSVLIKNKKGSEELLQADRIILAVGMKSQKELAYSFYGITPRTYIVGDCNKVARTTEATNEAYFIAANIE